ncbi:MAG: DUF1571 domain-containing protein, partial [Planctomycetales bacterium]|nr:DUF1571 domain-containing protein [Planctomycetales bacterium]
PQRRPEFKFHIARIYVSDARPVPIRYESYGWPEEQGGRPVLNETFTFQDLRLNVGFADEEFQRDYPAYGFRQ